MGCDNSTEPTDCAGVVGGTASLDNCNVCDNDSSNDNTTCSQDCAGVWGGDAVEDCMQGGACSNSPDGVELWGECYSIANSTELNLEDIGLTGEIPPEIGNLVNLTILILHDNQLSGDIPANIGNLVNLNHLSLSGNQLSSIPPEIGDLVNLTNLYLNGNQLSGSIPSEIGNLVNLIHLNLNGNQLSGEIPESICNIYTNISILNLYNNQLCPPYPSCLSETNIGEQDTSECQYCEDNTDDPYCDDE